MNKLTEIEQITLEQIVIEKAKTDSDIEKLMNDESLKLEVISKCKRWNAMRIQSNLEVW